MKDKIDFRIVIVALICLTVLEAIALIKGLNGVLLTTVLVIIAGVAGWTAPQLKLNS